MAGGRGFWPWGDRERTVVSALTEIGIPLRSYFWKGVVGTISVLCIVGSLYSCSLYVYLNSEPGRQVKVWAEKAWASFKLLWPLVLFVILVWWATYPALLFIIRQTMEQLFKAWKPLNFNRRKGKRK